MSDGTIGVGTVEAPINTGDATVKETPSSTGQESVASETVDQAGDSQESTDGSPVNGQNVRQRGKSVYSQVRELNAKLRDQRGYWESEVGTLKQQLQELRTQIAEGQPGRKQSKTFWEAPEEILEERLTSHLSNLEKRMQSKFEQTQAQREESQIRQQEVSEAAKYIRSQKGITDEDIQDIREILESNPDFEHLSPMKQAKFALYEWRESRGIGDNTAKKQRASTVTGAPVSSAGPKVWTESEIDAEIKKFPQDVRTWTPEQETRWKQLDDEIRLAYRQKRVTK